MFLLLLIFVSFLYLHFIFDLHFVVVVHLSMFFIYICFSKSSLTPPWTIAGFLHPFYTFSPVHRRVTCDNFIFNHSVFFLPRALRFWVGAFYPQAFFYLTLHRRHFTCVYQGLPGSRQFFLEVFRASNWSSKHRPSHLFVWFTIIHNLYIQNDSFLNSTIYQHELLAVKSLVDMLLTRFKLLSLVQDICKGY